MIGFPGAELSLHPDLSWPERLYIRCFGVPINGLRIRLRRVLPAIDGNYRRILDAGCGPGVFTMELAKRNPRAEVVGVDIDEEAVARAGWIARKAGIRNCRFEVRDVCALDFREEFDLALSVDNLEHLEDDVEALRSLRLALVPGGDLVVHVPGYYRRWLLWGRRVNFHVPGHVRPGYTAENLDRKLRAAGFRVLDARYTYGRIETFTNNISYLITGAERRNRHVYALVFPILLLLSYPGRYASPRWGAGVLARARRPAPVPAGAGGPQEDTGAAVRSADAAPGRGRD